MNTNNLVQFLRSKAFLGAIIVVFVLAVLVATFSAGVAVGYHKARFSYAWGENYARTFGGPRGGFIQNMAGHDFIDAHGIFGQIMKIDGPVILIRGQEGIERAVVVGPETSIKNLQDDVSLQMMHVDDRIVVIGAPNEQGQIQAKFIRIMPAGQPMPMPSRIR